MYNEYFPGCRPFDEECLENDKNVIVSEEYTRITEDAFRGNETIVSVQIDALFEEIEFGSFEDCKNLEQVNIPYTVKVIDDWAFSGCKKLKEMKLPPILSSIGDHAFKGCSALSTVAIPVSTKSIGASAFKLCKKLEFAYIHPTVKKIGKEAFAKCPNLTIVTTQGSTAEKYANKENIPVQLIAAAELEDQIKCINLAGEEIDMMALQFKMAQKQGYAAILQTKTGQVLVRTQIAYDLTEEEEDEFCPSSVLPRFYPQDEYRCYVLGRETIEEKVAELSNDAPEIVHGYIKYDAEKMRIATDEEAQKVFCEFKTICCACKSPEFMEWLYDFLPKKKNGLLQVDKKTTLAKFPLFYHNPGVGKDMCNAYSCNLIAKTESEEEVAIRVEWVDLTEQAHEDSFKVSWSSSVLPYEEMLDKASRYV